VDWEGRMEFHIEDWKKKIEVDIVHPLVPEVVGMTNWSEHLLVVDNCRM